MTTRYAWRQYSAETWMQHSETLASHTCWNLQQVGLEDCCGGVSCCLMISAAPNVADACPICFDTCCVQLAHVLLFMQPYVQALYLAHPAMAHPTLPACFPMLVRCSAVRCRHGSGCWAAWGGMPHSQGNWQMQNHSTTWSTHSRCDSSSTLWHAGKPCLLFLSPHSRFPLQV